MLHHSLLPGSRALGARSCGRCATSSSTSATSTAASSAPTSAPCCAGCCAWLRATAPTPTVVLASATVADPAEHAAACSAQPVRGGHRRRLTPRGRDLRALGAPADRCRTARRRSAVAESAELLADLVSAGVQTVAFARSRVRRRGRRQSARRLAGGARPATWRSRWPPTAAATCPRSDGRWSTPCASGRCSGWPPPTPWSSASTSPGWTPCVLAGWPGTPGLAVAAGRAGRRAGRTSLAVLVAADDPLDTYLVHHPERSSARPVEASVIDPDQPLRARPAPGCGGGRAAADAERPALVRAGLPALARRAGRRRRAASAAGRLVLGAAGPRRRPRRAARHRRRTGAHRRARHRPGAGHRRRGRRAHHGAHRRGLRAPGADLRGRRSSTSTTPCPSCTPATPAGARQAALDVTELRHRGRRPSTTRLGHRRRELSADGRRDHPGHLAPAPPARAARSSASTRSTCRRAPLRTTAVWWTLPAEELARAGVGEADIPGALHAAEHAVDRAAPARRDLRPVGHRRGVHRLPPRHRAADGHGLRRLSRAGRVSPAGLRAGCMPG